MRLTSFARRKSLPANVFHDIILPKEPLTMTQNRIDRMVAAATGESLSEIRRRGFSLADPWTVHHDPEAIRNAIDIEYEADDDERFVDWDTVQADRHVGIAPRRSRRHRSRRVA